MAHLEVDQDKIIDRGKAVALCPFAAILDDNGTIVITEDCRMCMICVKQGPAGAFVLRGETSLQKYDPGAWKGIAVYIEREREGIHPVSLELLGKAGELAAISGLQVSAVLIGSDLEGAAETVRFYGVDTVYLYNHETLKHFRPEPYAAVFERHVRDEKPSIVLVGGTVHGRSFAPRAAARLRTGLTADCTRLDYHPEHGLEQIRPAFGGNIMAHIRTPAARPQCATVRYKVFPQPAPLNRATGKIVRKPVSRDMVASGIEIIDVQPKPKEERIEDAEAIVVVGRGFRTREDCSLAFELAEFLGAQVAGTRPVIEDGWIDPLRQIGLSGRTVQPKLIITLGVSGSVQFVAGMRSSGSIIAVNRDRKAPIFKTAHYGIIGDIYEVVPALISRLKKRGGEG